MASSFTWLDFSEHERRQMLDVIQLFNDPATRDELGLGGVRDAFADFFFPGTSTIQTRAKYFLLIPWTYLALEEKQVSSGMIAQRARKFETELMLAIEQSGDSNGLVGRRAKENVQRLASSVYWLGLQAWGIRVFPGSQDEYHQSLDLFYLRRKGRHSDMEAFEGESNQEAELSNWHPGLPLPPEGFPQEATFTLTYAEASYLRERVLTNCPRSLLAHVLRERLQVDEFMSCWDMVAVAPVTLREPLQHGQNFSELMHGAQLLYNLMLAERRPWPEKQELYEEILSVWWEEISARRASILNWDIKRFWQFVRRENPRVSHRAQVFIDQWIGMVLQANTLSTLTHSSAARSLVELREVQLKQGQSRLRNRRPLELWSGAAGAGRMDLRWNAARRITADILLGLEEAIHA